MKYNPSLVRTTRFISSKAYQIPKHRTVIYNSMRKDSDRIEELSKVHVNDNHFILRLDNREVNSRITMLTSQSNLPGMFACLYLIGPLSVLAHDATLRCDKAEPGSTFLSQTIAYFCLRQTPVRWPLWRKWRTAVFFPHSANVDQFKSFPSGLVSLHTGCVKTKQLIKYSVNPVTHWLL